IAIASVPALRKYVDVGFAPGALQLPVTLLHPNRVIVYAPPPGGFCTPVLEQPPPPTIPPVDWHSKAEEPIRMPVETPLLGADESGSKLINDMPLDTAMQKAGTLAASTSASHVAPGQVEDQ